MRIPIKLVMQTPRGFKNIIQWVSTDRVFTVILLTADSQKVHRTDEGGDEGERGEDCCSRGRGGAAAGASQGNGGRTSREKVRVQNKETLERKSPAAAAGHGWTKPNVSRGSSSVEGVKGILAP